MNYTTLAFGLFLAFVVGPATAQQKIDRPLQNKKSDELRKDMRHHSVDAIREVGLRKDRASIPILRELVAETVPDEEVTISTGYIRPADFDRNEQIHLKRVARREATIALGRMGEGGVVEQYIVGLSSSNLNWKTECIQRLGEIGDPRSIPHLIPILDDNAVPPSAVPGHEKMMFSLQAAYALRMIRPDVHSQFAAKHGGRGILFPAEWKEWWATNKSIYKSK